MTLLTSGWYGRPVSSHVRLRRSTVLLLLCFVLLGALYLRTRPDDPSPESSAAVCALNSSRCGVGAS